MGKRRNDLSEREIRYDLLHGMRTADVALKHGCSERLVRKINARRGTRTRTLSPPDLLLCTSCGLKPRGPELRFLCPECFRDKEDDQELSVSPEADSMDLR